MNWKLVAKVAVTVAIVVALVAFASPARAFETMECDGECETNPTPSPQAMPSSCQTLYEHLRDAFNGNYYDELVDFNNDHQTTLSDLVTFASHRFDDAWCAARFPTPSNESVQPFGYASTPRFLAKGACAYSPSKGIAELGNDEKPSYQYFVADFADYMRLCKTYQQALVGGLAPGVALPWQPVPNGQHI